MRRIDHPVQTGVERYILRLLEALTATGEVPGIAVVIRATEADAFAAQGFPGVRVLPVADWRTTTLNRALQAFEPSVVHFSFEMPARLSLPSVFTLHDPGRYLYAGVLGELPCPLVMVPNFVSADFAQRLLW